MIQRRLREGTRVFRLLFLPGSKGYLSGVMSWMFEARPVPLVLGEQDCFKRKDMLASKSIAEAFLSLPVSQDVP